MADRNHHDQRAFAIRMASGSERFACRPDETILQAMTRGGVRPITAGCLGGACGICRVRVVSGNWQVAGPMSRAKISDQDMADGIVLACRVQPLGNLVLEVLGKGSVPQVRPSP